MNLKPLADIDRMAADVFGKSYREYQALKPTHYRWSHLAPRSVEKLEEAFLGNWSVEKIADYLHCGAEEAETSRRRYAMTRKVNASGGQGAQGPEGSESGEAGKLRLALGEWVALQPGMEDMGEAEKKRRAGELALVVANHLYAAGCAGEDIMKLSRALEGAEGGEPEAKRPGGGEPPKWGPQWKD